VLVKASGGHGLLELDILEGVLWILLPYSFFWSIGLANGHRPDHGWRLYVSSDTSANIWRELW
jgi:hypothetical protein